MVSAHFASAARFACPPLRASSLWRRRRSAGPGRRGGLSAGRGQHDAGYNLVMLVVMLTIINIMVAKSLPLWSAVIQREKEEELIFRGLQYAEAIRIYEMRTGGLPTKLEQLIEVEPRCIRQLWKNPLAEDGSWLLIPAGQGRQRPGQNQNQNQRLGQDSGRDHPPGGLPPEGSPGHPGQQDQGLLWVPGEDNEIGAVPIFGVKSSVGGESIKSFVANPNAPGGSGSTEISDWQFTVDLAKSLILKIDPNNPLPPSMNAAQRFKPWPPGIQPQNLPNTGRGGQSGRGGGIAPVVPGQGVPGRQPPGQQPGGGRGSGRGGGSRGEN